MVWAGDLALPLAFAAILWAGGASLIRVAGVTSRAVVAFGGFPLAVVLIGGLGLLQMKLSFAFGWVALGVAYAVAAALVGLARIVAGRFASRWRVGPGDPAQKEPSISWWWCGGLLAASGVLGLTVLWWATDGSYELVSQTWDAMFDANAVRFGFDTQNLAPTHLSTFPVPPGTGGSYYPATFHAVCVLFMQFAGTDAVVPTNVVAGLVAGLVWPSCAVLGAIFVAGARRWVIVASAVLAWGFYTAPWSPLGWGVLWATSLAAAVAPLFFAGLIQLLGWGLVRRSWPASAAVTLLGAGVMGFMHPRIVLVAIVLAAGLWTWTFAGRSLRARRARKPWLAAAGLAAAPMAAVLFLVLFVARDGIEARRWLVEWPMATEVWMHLSNGAIGTTAQWVTAALVLAGAWWAVRQGRSGLVVLWAGAMALDIVTATFQGNFAVNGLARFWYNDRHRVLPLIAFPALVLALLAVDRIQRRVGSRSATSTADPDLSPSLRPAVSTGPSAGRARAAAVAAAVVAVVIVANGVVAAVGGLRGSYSRAAQDPQASLVTLDEVALYRRIAQIVPPDQRIMNNANDGSALIYAYADRRPIFLIAGVRGSTFNAASAFDRFVHLSEHDLCVLVHEDHLGWLFDGGRAYSAGSILQEKAPGLQVPAGGHWALTPVLREGGRTLYQITGCGPI